jgi:hypothetical protein
MRWTATSCDGFLRGNVGGSTLLTSPLPGLDYNTDAWCGVLNGEYRVEVPFGSFTEDADKTDADGFVRWYRVKESDREAEASRNSCPLPDDELLPWRSERNLAVVCFRGTPQASGKGLRLLAKIDLYDHLDLRMPLRGAEALLEALVFRLGSIENALHLLDSNGSGKMGLMEFVGSLGLLGLDSEALTGTDDVGTFLGLDQDRDGFVQLQQFLKLRDAIKPKSPSKSPSKKKRRHGQGTANEERAASLAEIRLQAPIEDAMEVWKAKIKWSHIARWMAAANQRSIALRTERLLKGWRPDDNVLAQQQEENQAAEGDGVDMEVQKNAEDVTQVIAEGDPGSPSSCLGSTKKSSASVASATDSPKKCITAITSIVELDMRPRRRSSTSTPKELTLESLDIMREQEYSLKARFFASASVKLPDGTPEMSRADLHTFFQDLQLADWEMYTRLTPDVLDKHYDEATALQCNFTRIGNGLTFWSLKVILNNIIGDLGLKWDRLVQMALSPEAVEDACAPTSPK